MAGYLPAATRTAGVSDGAQEWVSRPLQVAGGPPFPGRPQSDELRHGFGDGAVSRHPPSNCAWVHLESAGRLHLADPHPLEVAFEF